jgi:hypothetical protein
VDMVFVAAVLVSPGGKANEWEINSVELGGYNTDQPRVSVKMGFRKWTDADVAVRLKKDVKVMGPAQALELANFDRLTEALVGRLASGN